MMWLIVRSAFQRELALARRIEGLGHPVWVPMETRFQRITGPVKTKRNRIWETPVIPTVLFAAIPKTAWGDVMACDGFAAFQRPNAVSEPYSVQDSQIARFRDMVDRENIIRRRQYERRQEGKRGKRTVKLGDENALAILLQELFGLEQPMAEAA